MKDLWSVGSADYIRRYVWSEFGRDPSGAAVFAESFKYDYHVASHRDPVTGFDLEELSPVYSRMLDGGAGLRAVPLVTHCQLDHSGRLLGVRGSAG